MGKKNKKKKTPEQKLEQKQREKAEQTPRSDFKLLYYGIGFLALGLGMQYFSFSESKAGNYVRMIFLWIAVVLNVMYIMRLRANRKK